MTRVTIDNATRAKLQGQEPLQVCSESGEVIGYFHPLVQGIKSPISDEELDRRRQERTGRPLFEILEQFGET